MLRPRYPAISAALIAVLVAFGALFSGPVPAASALTNCDVSDLSVSSEELAFLSLINAYRAANGAGPLTISENLNRAASYHAVDMASNNRFSHTDSSGRSSSTRMFQCNVASGGTGENIAAGTSWDTAQEVFDAWKNSSGHNTNMLRSTYKQIGIARHYDSDSRYKYYWVTDFNSVNDGTNLGGGSSGGGGSTTPPAPVAPAKASMLSPEPGTELPDDDVTFEWSAGSGAQEYFLYVGTSRGRNNLYAASLGMNRQTTVYDLPTDGDTLYVRLWTLLPGGWAYTDYTYRAAD
jgi:uncharacterized protein YkwD